MHWHTTSCLHHKILFLLQTCNPSISPFPNLQNLKVLVLVQCSSIAKRKPKLTPTKTLEPHKYIHKSIIYFRLDVFPSHIYDNGQAQQEEDKSKTRRKL